MLLSVKHISADQNTVRRNARASNCHIFIKSNKRRLRDAIKTRTVTICQGERPRLPFFLLCSAKLLQTSIAKRTHGEDLFMLTDWLFLRARQPTFPSCGGHKVVLTSLIDRLMFGILEHVTLLSRTDFWWQPQQFSVGEIVTKLNDPNGTHTNTNSHAGINRFALEQTTHVQASFAFESVLVWGRHYGEFWQEFDSRKFSHPVANAIMARVNLTWRNAMLT